MTDHAAEDSQTNGDNVSRDADREDQDGSHHPGPPRFTTVSEGFSDLLGHETETRDDLAPRNPDPEADYVVNHTAVSHPFCETAPDPDHPDHERYRDWYRWDEDGGIETSFTWDDIPNLNYGNPARSGSTSSKSPTSGRRRSTASGGTSPGAFPRASGRNSTTASGAKATSSC